MGVSEALPVNHHADHPGFSGVTAVLPALLFLVIGRSNARLAVDLARVSENDRVVDIGCGPGNAVREAARRGAQATGVDPSSVFLRIARVFTRDQAGVVWAEGTAENVPVPDGAATVVWSLATVHHWKDVGLGLGEAHRVLAPKGRLLAIERRSQPGATGLASHGWTQQQAESFAAQCRTAGFDDVAIGQHGQGRRAVWTVSAARP
jgi:ubiquinone/menaquinone biosynthesis C-methylase UbiE